MAFMSNQMKKFFSYLILICNIQHFSYGQVTTSFYIDSVSSCFFTDTAIYFGAANGLVKTDFSGNILWAKHNAVIPNSIFDLSIHHESIYGINDSCVFKMDTSGNSIWIRNLSALMHPMGGYKMELNDVTTDNDGIFISMIQHDQFYNGLYKSQVRFDTSGSVTNAWSNSIASSHYDHVVSGVSSATGKGAWLASYFSAGITKDFIVTKIDSSGNVDMNASVVNGGATQWLNIPEIIQLKDSNYLLIAYGGNFNSSEFIWLNKFNESGNILWGFQIQSAYSNSGMSLAEALSITSDDSGNLYMLGQIMDSSGFDRPVIFKFDSNGSFLFCKSWSSSILNSVPVSLKKIYFHNGAIFSFCSYLSHFGIVAFDTSFTNSCFSPDTLFNFTINTSGYTGSPIQYPSIGYSSPAVPLFASSDMLLQSTEFCSSLSQDNLGSKDMTDFEIFFNQKMFNLSFNCTINNTASLFVYDSEGRLIDLKDLYVYKGNNKIRIDLNIHAKGLYFFRLVMEGKAIVKKIMVTD